jgi:hypothetical protein
MSMIADPPLFAWPRSLPAKNDAAITGSCVIGPAPTLLTFDHRLGTEANASHGPGLARGTVRRGPEGKALTGPSVRSQQGPPPAQAGAPPGTGCRRARENRSSPTRGPAMCSALAPGVKSGMGCTRAPRPRLLARRPISGSRKGRPWRARTYTSSHDEAEWCPKVPGVRTYDVGAARDR